MRRKSICNYCRPGVFLLGFFFFAKGNQGSSHFTQVLASKAFFTTKLDPNSKLPPDSSPVFFHAVLYFPALIKHVGRVCSLLPTKHCWIFMALFIC